MWVHLRVVRAAQVSAQGEDNGSAGLGEHGRFGIAGFIDDLGVLPVPHIANPLEKEKRKDVGHKVGRIYRAA